MVNGHSPGTATLGMLAAGSDTITLAVESWPVRHCSSVLGKCATGHCTGAIY